MPGKDIPDSFTKSPLAAAVLEARMPARSLSPAKTPWRQNFEHSLMESIQTAGNRSAIGTRLDAIERITRPHDDYVLSHLCSVLESRIAPLGEEGAIAFLDAMWSLSPRAKVEFGEPEQAGNSIMVAADKFGNIAANVPNGRVFSLVCRGMERIKDFKVLSKYINYMLALSRQLRSERNPEGAVKLQDIEFHAKFIADRCDGDNHKYVDERLTEFLRELNELVSKSGPKSP